jgi:cation diffusion facilitator family transporter
MFGVLVVNVAVSVWEGAQARKLRSDILLADARHTLTDVLITIAVIVGWQVAALGFPWVDSAFALGVAVLVLYLAYGLFARVIPVLVDEAALEPEEVARVALEIPGVRGVESIRSRRTGVGVAVDMIVRVRAHLPTSDAHEIADGVERAVLQRFHAHDVTVHIEPEDDPASD